MTPEEEVIRAGQARQLLDSPLFIEACKRVSDSLADQRKRVPVRDTDMHTRLIITEQLWGNIQDWLTGIAETGKLAQFEINQREARKGLFSNWRA